MTDVKAFGNIWRGILDDDFLPCSYLVVAVRWDRGLCEGVHLGKNLSNHVGGVDPKMEEGFVEDYGFNPLITFELGYILSDDI